MTQCDIDALELAAQGEGSEQAPITRRCLRGILAELRMARAASRATEAFERIVGSRVG